MVLLYIITSLLLLCNLAALFVVFKVLKAFLKALNTPIASLRGVTPPPGRPSQPSPDK